MILHFLSVAIGGAFGAIVRYAIALFMASHVGVAVWAATLSVNVSGSLLMGLAAGYVAVAPNMTEPLRLGLTVGFLGALTTFSTYALDSYALLQRGEILMLISYVVGSVVLSLAAFGVGIIFIRQFMVS